MSLLGTAQTGVVDQVFQHLIPTLSDVWTTTSIIGWTIGFYLVIKALVIAGHPSKERLVRGAPGLASLLGILGGSMLMALPAFTNMLTQTYFRQNAPTYVLEYAPAANISAGTGTELRFVVTAIHLLGLIAVIRGVMALTKAHQGEGTIAAVLLATGPLALRIGLFIKWMGISMGPTVSSYVQKFF